MTQLFACVATTLLLAASPPSALDARPPGQLAGLIAVGKSPDFIDEWLTTPPEHTPRVPAAMQFAIGETAYIAFVVTGAQSDPEGRTHVTVDVRITRPDKTVLLHQEAYATMVRQAADRAAFTMANPALDLVFESGDPLGDWSVVAIFHDKVANKASIAEVCLKLGPKKA